MKKLLVVALMTVFVLSFALTACAPAQTNLIMATGGTSGTYYPFGGAMAQIFSNKVEGLNVTAQTSGASVENCKLLGKKEVELAILQNDMLDYAYNGLEAFEGKKIDSVRALATLYPEVVQIVVSADSGISSVEEFKGQKISVGAPGSGVEANTRQILDAVGISYDDFSTNYLSFSESAEQFKDKHLKGFIFTSGVPNAAIQDIGATQEVQLLSLSDEVIEELTAKYPFFTKHIIPAGTYNGQTADVKTVAVKATLAVGKDLSESVVYDITKALFENQEELATVHAKGSSVKLESAVQGISIPFHPGAEKYYKEKGILK